MSDKEHTMIEMADALKGKRDQSVYLDRLENMPSKATRLRITQSKMSTTGYFAIISRNRNIDLTISMIT